MARLSTCFELAALTAVLLGCSETRTQPLEPATRTFILNGETDAVRHAHVGASCMVLIEGDPWICFPGAGVLVSKNVVVSVAHAGPFIAAVQPVRIGITFDAQPSATSPIYEATYLAHPDWDPGNAENPMDLGVFLLRDPVENPRPARLPPVADFLADQTIDNSFFTIVGYGLASLTGWPSQPSWGNRLSGRTGALRVHSGSVVTQSSAQYPQTPCFGDSGSGLFYRDSDIVIGTYSGPLAGDCSVGLYTRLDTRAVRQWLSQFL